MDLEDGRILPVRFGRRRWLAGLGVGVAALTGSRSQAATGLSAPPKPRRRRDIRSLRDEYDLDERITYLNHASIGTIPRVVREARQRYDLQCERNPWHHVWGDAWEQEVADLREKLANFAGCKPLDLALLHTTTEGFNVLAQGLPLGEGDEVLFSSLNHVGASECWTHRAPQRGFSVRKFPFPVDDVPGMTAEDVVEIHLRELRPNTRVLVFPHVDNKVGLRHPMARLVGAARARGVEFVAVDGAQTAGMFPLNLERSGVDFYATSTHKWLQSPKGTGFLYVRKKWVAQLDPLTVTWGAKRWKNDARRYEDIGTHDYGTWLTLKDALEFHQRWSDEERSRRLETLFQHVQARTDANASLTWHSPRTFENGASLVAVGLKQRESSPVAKKLFEEGGFVTRAFGSPFQALRVSPNLVNTAEDVDRFFDALEREWGRATSRQVTPTLPSQAPSGAGRA